MMVGCFVKGLDEIAKIPDLEPKILSDLYKSQKNETYIKAPMKPREKPRIPDPNERPRKYPDENKWIWDIIEDLEEKLNKGLEPLQVYLQKFDAFKPVLALNPDSSSREIEDAETPWEIEEIIAEI